MAHAKILYIAAPDAKSQTLNFQFGDTGSLWQIDISREQLAGLVLDGTKILLADITADRVIAQKHTKDTAVYLNPPTSTEESPS